MPHYFDDRLKSTQVDGKLIDASAIDWGPAGDPREALLELVEVIDDSIEKILAIYRYKVRRHP